jgi:hypothetical protein
MPPIPGQTVKPAAQSADQGQSQGQDNQATASAAPSLVEKLKQPTPTDPHSGQVAGEDKEHSVKLTSLPSVTLTDKPKGFWDHVLDWGPWVSNFLLVVVGGFQVWLLKRTWKTIERQADLLERQTDAAARSTEAFINKERSRLFIRAEISDDFVATFYAVNRGLSPARVTYGFVGCEIFDKEEKFSAIPEYTNGDPAWVFSQNEWLLPERESRIGSYAADYISESENPELHESVISREYTVWFYGVVRYSDSVSEDPHEVRFCYETGFNIRGKKYLSASGPHAYRKET